MRKSRSRRRRATKRARKSYSVRMIANPPRRRRRAASSKRTISRRRRNPTAPKVGLGQILAGAAGAVAGVMAVGFILPRVIDMKKNPYLYLGAGAALGLAGGMVVGKMNTAAGIGVGGGVVSALALPYVSALVAPALPTAPSSPTAGYLYPTGAVEIPMGAVEIPMGAVEIPTGAMYDVDGDGMVAMDDGYSYDDDA